MASVKPFTVNIPTERLEKLRARLELTEFPDELDDAGWDYGAPLADVKRLTSYWKDGFDWKKQEAEINTLPQFQTRVEVDGYEALTIHFVHQTNENPKAIPLLFVHGCTSFVETEKKTQIFLIWYRAWQFLRSGEAAAPTCKTEWEHPRSGFPRCGAIFAQLRLLRWRQKAWLRSEAVRRDLSQADATARV